MVDGNGIECVDGCVNVDGDWIECVDGCVDGGGFQLYETQQSNLMVECKITLTRTLISQCLDGD